MNSAALTNNGMFTAFWPITDRDQPMDNLIEDATADLPKVAHIAGAHITGPTFWRRCPGSQFPGAGSYAEVLAVLAPARQTAPRRDNVAASRARLAAHQATA